MHSLSARILISRSTAAILLHDAGPRTFLLACYLYILDICFISHPLICLWPPDCMYSVNLFPHGKLIQFCYWLICSFRLGLRVPRCLARALWQGHVCQCEMVIVKHGIFVALFRFPSHLLKNSYTDFYIFIIY